MKGAPTKSDADDFADKATVLGTILDSGHVPFVDHCIHGIIPNLPSTRLKILFIGEVNRFQSPQR